MGPDHLMCCDKVSGLYFRDIRSVQENKIFPCVKENRCLGLGFFFCRRQGGEKRGIRKIGLISFLINQEVVANNLRKR